jgi:hypothetical protein
MLLPTETGRTTSGKKMILLVDCSSCSGGRSMIVLTFVLFRLRLLPLLLLLLLLGHIDASCCLWFTCTMRAMSFLFATQLPTWGCQNLADDFTTSCSTSFNNFYNIKNRISHMVVMMMMMMIIDLLVLCFNMIQFFFSAWCSVTGSGGRSTCVPDSVTRFTNERPPCSVPSHKMAWRLRHVLSIPGSIIVGYRMMLLRLLSIFSQTCCGVTASHCHFFYC